MDFTRRLLDWYDENARALPWRESAAPYAVWVSEIMLQQTRVGAVLTYYTRWMRELPDIRALSEASDEKLHKLWEGLGYYSRARNLKRAAGEIEARFGGELPRTFEELRSLPGIGDYTAGAIASIAFNEPVPAVDGNVLRVWARLTDDHRDVLELKTRRAFTGAIAAVIPADAPGRFNAALMELGETLCLPNAVPLCDACPLKDGCRAHALGTAAALPLRGPKKARRVEHKTVFALLNDGRPAVYRRADTGLLAGLWQLPEAAGVLTAAEAAERLSAWHARPLGDMRVYERKHLFTHIEWRMRVYAVETDMPLPAGWAWLNDGMALPTAYRVCLR